MSWAGVVLLGMAGAVPAQECFSQAPSLAGGKDPYQVLTPTRLSKEGAKSIEKLFKKLKGRWAGEADGFFCRGTEAAPRREDDDFRVAMEAVAKATDALEITSDLTEKNNRTSRSERLRLMITDGTLRANRDDPGGDVEILDMSRNGSSIAFLHKEIKSGGGGFTEILRRIKVSGTSLTIVYDVYTRGGLTSSSTWKLKKK